MIEQSVEKEDIFVLESKLEKQKDPFQRLIIIDQLLSHYIFTNVERSKILLNEFETLLKNTPNTDFRLNYFLYSSTLDNQRYQFDSAEKHLLKALDLIEEVGSSKQQIDAYTDYMGICMNLENKEKAEELLFKAQKLLKSFPDEHLQARLTCREAFLKLHYSDYAKAIELLMRADKMIHGLSSPLEIKDHYFLTLIHSGLGKIYEHNEERVKSIASYLKVVEMCQAIEMRSRLSWHYLNVGNGFMSLSELDEAEKYFLRAIDVADDLSQEARASAYANLGYCAYAKEDFRKSLKLLEKAEQLYNSTDGEDYYNLSNIDAWRGRIFSDLQDEENAIHHFAKALEYASIVDDYKQLASVCRDIATFYSTMEDYKNAYEYQLVHEKYVELYMEEVNRREQLELEVKYEAEKKKQETELLKLQATQLQLKALRAQMNPHFIYNALNAIQQYITSHEVSSATKYLAKFAKLMRQSLENSELEIISLEKEIEFLKDYLFINEKLRFENEMSYKIVIDDDIEEDILGVPTMIVQPYVENAIEHGLRTKKNGHIKVEFKLLDDDTILCAIEDNGIGRKKARQLQLLDLAYQNHRSRGTIITEKRLQLLHHAKKNDLYVSTIDLVDEKTNEPLGTRVEVKIPIVDIQLK